MAMRIGEPRHDAAAAEIDDARSSRRFAIVPDAHELPPCDNGPSCARPRRIHRVQRPVIEHERGARGVATYAIRTQMHLAPGEQETNEREHAHAPSIAVVRGEGVGSRGESGKPSRSPRILTMKCATSRK
jgi:hypothetical protein